MKITKRQLRRIIKEEKQRLLSEFYGDNIETGSDLIDFAQAYAGLGNAVQEQVNVVVAEYINGGGPGSDRFQNVVYEQNPNAIDMAMDKLGRVLRYKGLGEEGEFILEALEDAQKIFLQGDEEVEEDTMAAEDL